MPPRPRNLPLRTCSARYALPDPDPAIYCLPITFQVNNAYEVLSDPQNRSTYDQHGVWPPPAPAPPGPFPNGHHDPFSNPPFRGPFHDPFFRGPRMEPFGAFGFGSQGGPRGFTDPFVLFNSIFGDLHRAFGFDPFSDDPFGHRGFGSNHFGGGFSNSGAFPPMTMPSPFDYSGGGMGSSRVQTFSNGGNGGRWISQSWSSSTVNGVTTTKSVQRDSQVCIRALCFSSPLADKECRATNTLPIGSQTEPSVAR